jgi:hypothetical protein
MRLLFAGQANGKRKLVLRRFIKLQPVAVSLSQMYTWRRFGAGWGEKACQRLPVC